MALKINPRADGNVRIPVGEYSVTVAGLRDIDTALLASTVNLSIEDFENSIREWARGVGRPYGVMAHMLTDAEYERFRELNNELQTLMTKTFMEDPTSAEVDDIAQAKREVGRGIDKFLTLIGR